MFNVQLQVFFGYFRIHTTSVELERYACVLRLLSMKETCQNLVRSVVQREDLQIQKENSGKENRMLKLSRIWIGDQCDRWNELRSVLRVKTNTEVAKILLDW
jgi:hypothetical protein